MSYVPIQFPTWSYGPDGSAVVVQTPVQLAALPPVYAPTPTFVPAPVVTAVPMATPQQAIAPLVAAKVTTALATPSRTGKNK